MRWNDTGTAVGGEIQAIGFGIPCTFDSRSGMAVQAVNVPLKDIAFGAVMAERLRMPVVVDNDANCHTVCESRNVVAVAAGRGDRDRERAAVVDDDIELAGERVGRVGVGHRSTREREDAAEPAGVLDVDGAFLALTRA